MRMRRFNQKFEKPLYRELFSHTLRGEKSQWENSELYEECNIYYQNLICTNFDHFHFLFVLYLAKY